MLKKSSYRFLPLLLVLLFVIGFAGSSPMSRDKGAYRHYYKGLSLYSDSDYSKAASELGKAYRSWPENFNFSLAYALALSKNGHYRQGLRILKKNRISDTDPYREHKKALLFLANALVHHNGGESSAAISALGEGIAWLQRTGSDAHLATFYNTLGLLRLYNQGMGGNHNGLGEHYHVHKRDMEKVLRDFEKAVSIDPDHIQASGNLQTIADTLGVKPRVSQKRSASGNVRSRNSLVTGLPQDVDRVMELADFDEVVLLVDISGSMVEESVICMDRTRFEVMRNLGLYLVDELPEDTQIGLGTIGGDCGDSARTWEPVGGLSRRDLRYKVRFLNAHGTTPMVERLKKAEKLFSDDPKTTKGLFLISDGANVCPERSEGVCAWAGRMRSKGITLNVLTFLDVSFNNVDAFAEYGCLADNTEGRIFYLDNVDCAFSDLTYQWLTSLQPRLPKLEKVYCWGPRIESLWAIFPEE
jgi:tetratricopeptide (TPR) repeat protein